MLEPKALSKSIFAQAKELNVKKICLAFSGGSDEGYLDVHLDLDDDQKQVTPLINLIEEWAWETYRYNGAGDGTDYGDDIVYDLSAGKVHIQDWCTERNYGDDIELEITVLEDE